MKIWLIALIVMIALNIWSLKKSPPVGMDDTLESAIAHNLIENGRFALTMNRVIVRYDENDMVLGRLHLGGLALTGSIFGPSITSDRLWPLCMALVALYVFWQLAKSSLGSYWGIVAVALCLTEPMFFSFSHIPRPEMAMAAVFLLGIFCGKQALLNMSSSWLFLAGLLGTLAIDVHLPGIILAPSIAVALISLQKRKVLFLPDLFWFIIGAFIGLSWYLAWHVLANPKLFALQWDFHIYINSIIKTSFSTFLAQIPKEYLRYYQWFWGTGPQKIRLLEGFLIIFGLIIQLRSRNLGNRYLGIVSLSLVIIMGLTVNRKVVYYLLPLYPLFVLNAIVGLRFLIVMGRPIYLRKRSKSLSEIFKVTGIAFLTGLFIFYFLQDVRELYKYRHVDYERYLAEITAIVPSGALVAGSPSLWYGLGKRNNLLSTVSVLWAIDYNKFRGYPETSAAEIMRQEKIEFVVIEPYVRKLINSQETASGSSMMNFLHSECKLLKAFRNEKYIGIGECPEGELTEVFAVVTLRHKH